MTTENCEPLTGSAFVEVGKADFYAAIGPQKVTVSSAKGKMTLERALRALTETMMENCEECIATPDTMIDLLHPTTGRTVIYGKTLDEVRAERLEYATAERMGVDEFCQRKATLQRTPITWTETTGEQFENMLGCLPPAAYATGAFLVGEPCDHDAGNGQPRYAAYRERNNKFEVASRPMTRAEFRQELK